MLDGGWLDKNIVPQEGEIFLRNAGIGEKVKVGQDFYYVLGKGSDGKVLARSVKSGDAVEILASTIVKKEK